MRVSPQQQQLPLASLTAHEQAVAPVPVSLKGERGVRHPLEAVARKITGGGKQAKGDAPAQHRNTATVVSSTSGAP